MPRTTIVLPTPANDGDVTVTTSQTNLLSGAATAITAGSMTNGVPLGDVESYSIVVRNTGGQDITLSLWLAAGPNTGLQVQRTETVAATTGVWTYQLSGNAARALALTAVAAASTTTVRADFCGVVYQ